MRVFVLQPLQLIEYVGPSRPEGGYDCNDSELFED